MSLIFGIYPQGLGVRSNLPRRLEEKSPANGLTGVTWLITSYYIITVAMTGTGALHITGWQLVLSIQAEEVGDFIPGTVT